MSKTVLFSIDNDLVIMSNIATVDLTDYKKAFAQAHADLEKLTEEREEIDRKISRLKQAIVGLAPLAEEAGPMVGVTSILARSFAEAGMTDAIREILSSSQKPLTPLEVKERLLQMKPSASAQSNIMASIHTVLKRLVPKEATSSTSKEGDVVYAWKFSREKLVDLVRKARAKDQARTIAPGSAGIADIVPGELPKTSKTK